MTTTRPHPPSVMHGAVVRDGGLWLKPWEEEACSDLPEGEGLGSGPPYPIHDKARDWSDPGPLLTPVNDP